MRPNKALILAAFSLTCVVGMVLCWWTKNSDIARVLTYFASSSFVGVALLSGAHRSLFGRLILIGVVCCWTGDIVGPKNFLAGAGAFLVGHIFFMPAFVVRGIRRKELIAGFVLFAVVSGIALAWIGPKVPEDERLIIYAYTGVIGLMGAISVGAWSTDRWLPIGATIFYISDLFLAQTAFLDGGFINTALGYPLYYFAVLTMAYSPSRLPFSQISPG